MVLKRAIIISLSNYSKIKVIQYFTYISMFDIKKLPYYEL